MRLSVVLIALLALPVALLAGAALLGVGVLREAAPIVVTLGAGLALLLPSAGLVWAFRDRPLGAALSPGVVGLLWLVALPAYFPGERAPALAAGMGAVQAGLGDAPDPLLAARIDALLPGLPDGRSPVAAAAPLAPPALPAPPTLTGGTADAGDQVALPYEGEGRALKIPVAWEGPAGEVEVTMIFDTGATFTTLSPAALARMGVAIPDDAPTLRFHTAGGEREAPLVYLERVWVGGFSVEGVTVGVCADCASDDSVGLLGLNVSRRFLVTVDQARQELVLEPRREVRDSTSDIRPWVRLAATATRFADGRVEVVVDLDNDGPRDLLGAEVLVACGEGWTVPLGPVPSGEGASTTVSLGLGADCPDGYTVSLSRASW